MTDEDKTSLYGNSDKDKTSTYGKTEKDSTSAYGKDKVEEKALSSESDKTGVYETADERSKKSHTIHGIEVGDKLMLKEIEYKVEEIVSEGTGEAVIYKVSAPDKNIYALKIYYEFANENEEPNHETLKRLKNFKDPDILKLIEYGVGNEKFNGLFCYEIAEFALGGDLFSTDDIKKKYTPVFIEKEVIPQAINSIEQLHKLKIYHCDIKPSNMFYRDSEQTDLVVGDYGSAKAYDLESEKDIRKSSTVKGTEAYLPPEQARGIVSEKNDYYSLGMVLLHLLYPESIGKDEDLKVVSPVKFEKIIERQYNSVPVIDFDRKYKRINSLIEGLTMANHLQRWGDKEVKRWMKGESPEIRYSSASEIKAKPIKLGYATLQNEKDLVNLIETRQNWYADLVEDEDTYATLKGWLDNIRDIPTRKTFDNLIKFYQTFGEKEYLKEALLRFFEPERPIKIDMYAFNLHDSTDISSDVESLINKIDQGWKITRIGKLRFYLFQLEFALLQLKESSGNPAIKFILEKLYAPFGLLISDDGKLKTQIQSKISVGKIDETNYYLVNLFHTFNKNRVFVGIDEQTSFSDIELIGLYFIKNEELYNDAFLKAELKGFLQKNNLQSYISSNIREFEGNVFSNYSEIDIRINAVDITGKNMKVGYRYTYSLTDFLKSKGINKDYMISANELQYSNSFNGRIKIRQQLDLFLKDLKQSLKLANLPAAVQKSVENQFRAKTNLIFIKRWGGAAAAFLIFILLGYLIYVVISQKI